MNMEHMHVRRSNRDAVTLSVIAPCFNEEDNIDPLVERTLAVVDSISATAELVLVDDGSSDATWERINRWSQSDLRVRGCRHADNRGIVPAWRTGLEASSGDLVCLIDADLQNRPEDIPRLYEAFKDGPYDVIQAARHPVQATRGLNRFSRALRFLLNATFRMRLRDSKSGFIVCRRETLEAILQHRYRYRYFQSFIGVSAGVRGFTIGEVDTVFDARVHGRSFLGSFPLLVSARIAWELVKFRVETWALRMSGARRGQTWSAAMQREAAASEV